MTTTERNPVTLVRDGAVAILTIDRPARSNAVDGATAAAIAAHMAAIEADDGIRVGVLTGSGTRVFCGGSDLKAKAAAEGPSTVPGAGFAGFVTYPRTKPFVAAVNGAAVGGGFELALACDLVVASTAAYFALPEVGRGLVAAGGGVVRLPRRIPYAVAAEVVLAGRRLDAAEALALGLVNRVVPPEEVLAAALELARRCAQGAPLAVRESLAVMRAAADSTGDPWALQEVAHLRVGASADGREGPRAYAEKRAPVWVGR